MIDEPCSAVYYLGPERISDRYPLTEPDSTIDHVLDELERGPLPLFVKDMIHHVPAERRHAVATMGRHTLLTRDPARAIPSFAKVWPDVTWEECGYEALAAFATHLEEHRIPFDVVDAGGLMAEPDATLRAWCARHDLPFDPTTVRWEPGAVPQWTRWLDFHTSAIASTGFEARTPGPAPTVDDGRISEMIERASPLHDALVARTAPTS
mgnify:FL=1